MSPSRRQALAWLAALPLTSTAQPRWQPTRPIRLVLPYPAGGQTDAIARHYAQRVEATLGQSMIVDNRPGANSLLGTQTVARSPADGHTLLFNMTAIVTNAVLQANPGYDVFRDFVPVHRTYELYATFAVPASAPHRTLADFVAAAKASKDPLTYGTAGHASSSHYFIELMARQAGIRMVHVPYKGEAPLLPDLIEGRVHSGVISGASIKRLEAEGKVRGLAVSGNARVGLLPGLPTFREQGFDGIGNESFAGFFAPAGTPVAVVERLNAEFNRVAQLPETRERLAVQAVEPCAPGTPEEFAAIVRRAYDEWTTNRRKVDIPPE